MKRCILVVLLLSGFSPPPARAETAPPDSVRREATLRLLRLTMPDSTLVQMVGQMVGVLHEARPDIPAETWGRLLQHMGPDLMREMAAEVYERHFTNDEVREITAMFESPIGRRYLREQRPLIAELSEAGRLWGRRAGEKAYEEYEREQEELRTTPGD